MGAFGKCFITFMVVGESLEGGRRWTRVGAFGKCFITFMAVGETLGELGEDALGGDVEAQNFFYSGISGNWQMCAEKLPCSGGGGK